MARVFLRLYLSSNASQYSLNPSLTSLTFPSAALSGPLARLWARLAVDDEVQPPQHTYRIAVTTKSMTSRNL